jgi:hypothetical protein
MSKIKSDADVYFTQTMAEVLEEQGHFEDALIIYKILADTNPWDETLSFKVNRLKGKAGSGKRKGPLKKVSQKSSG